MRLVAGALAVVLAHSLALADTPRPVRVDPKPTMQLEVPQPTRTKVPVRVVRILPESKQAVLLDRTGGAQVVVSVGDKIGAYIVDSIDEDEVTLLAQGKEVVLTAPSSTWLPLSATPAPAPAPAPVAAVAPNAGPALEDPYGAPAPAPAPAASSTEPLDPYAEQQPVREVKVPSWIDPVDPSAPTAEAAPAPAPAPAPASEPSTPYDDSAPAASGAPAPAAAPTVGPAPAPAAADPSLSRRDVAAALSDFAGLTGAMRASFTPAGAKIESIADGSLFAKAGLRAGDVIASIDGKPLRSLDDVAALYARAATLRLVTAQVVRGGKPITLRVTIQ